MGSRFGLDGAEDGSADDGADEADECRPGSKKMPSHRKMAGQRKVKLLLHDHGDRGVVDDAVGEVQVNRESALRAYISARLRLSFLFVGMMSLHYVLPILLYRGHVFLLGYTPNPQRARPEDNKLLSRFRPQHSELHLGLHHGFGRRHCLIRPKDGSLPSSRALR